ncbi:MAG: hypothetical protein K5752_06635 [Succinivibrionaceae bacterium]|jgi:hypothetical protein|nr:hypothetical protein [Succinivibrionaceae bacterium]
MTDTVNKFNKFIFDHALDRELSRMRSAKLKITEKQVNRAELQGIISGNQDTWFMYTDEIRIGRNIKFEPERYLLEAEFIAGGKSVKIRLLHGQTYLVVCYEPESSDGDSDLCYMEQKFESRRDLRKYVENLNYRIWYKLDNENGNCVPFVQQFIGFDE